MYLTADHERNYPQNCHCKLPPALLSVPCSYWPMPPVCLPLLCVPILLSFPMSFFPLPHRCLDTPSGRQRRDSSNQEKQKQYREDRVNKGRRGCRKWRSLRRMARWREMHCVYDLANMTLPCRLIKKWKDEMWWQRYSQKYPNNFNIVFSRGVTRSAGLQCLLYVAWFYMSRFGLVSQILSGQRLIDFVLVWFYAECLNN